MPAADPRTGVSRSVRWCVDFSSRHRRLLAGAAVPVLLLLWPWNVIIHQGSANVSAASHGGSTATLSSASDPPPAAETPAAQLSPVARQHLSEQAPPAAADKAPLVTTYTVSAGDTLISIAARLGTDVASLEKINGLNDSSVLQPGQQLTALRMVGWLYQVEAGDTLSSIASATGVSGSQLASVNDLTGASPVLQPGEQLVIPKDPVVPEPAATVAAASSDGSIIWPVRGPITSPFGFRPDPWTETGSFFHNGIDIGVPTGTPVAAACSGRVVIAGWDGGYGLAVQIDCDNGLDTLYGHNSVMKSSVGERIQQGGLIAYSGMTGNATGPHVHFGVMRGGTWVNPLHYLP